MLHLWAPWQLLILSQGGTCSLRVAALAPHGMTLHFYNMAIGQWHKTMLVDNPTEDALKCDIIVNFYNKIPYKKYSIRSKVWTEFFRFVFVRFPSQLKLSPIKPTQQQQRPRKSARFVFSNYNRYYGCRSGQRMETDPRVLALRPEWCMARICWTLGAI